MGALVGLGVGIGLLLIWSAFVLPVVPASGPGRRGGCDRCSIAPVSGKCPLRAS